MSRNGLAFLCMLFVITPLALSAAPITYDESVGGDLPFSASDKVFDLGLGTNTITGEAGWFADTNTFDFDSFTFVIRDGWVLAGGSLTLNVPSPRPGTSTVWAITDEIGEKFQLLPSTLEAGETLPVDRLLAGVYRMRHLEQGVLVNTEDFRYGYRFELIVAQEGSVVVTDLVAMPNPVAVQGTVDSTAMAWGSTNINTAAWTLKREGDVIATGIMDPEDGNFDTPREKLRARDLIAPYEAGIYDLCVNATAVDSNISEDACIDLVVYDPSAGFVTGGGWIWSPLGAMVADPGVAGRANFGFVSRYRRGANVPDGNTQFVFQAGGLNFHSSTYEWLVVTGNSYARFKGAGTVNGANAETGQPYQFMIWAGDGDPDTLRIKIWFEEGGEVPVYDNGMNQPIGSGQIVVHSGGSKKQALRPKECGRAKGPCGPLGVGGDL